MQKKKILVLVIIILLLALSFALSGKEGAETEQIAQEQPDATEEQSDMTMEEYEAELFEDRQQTEPQGPVELTIVSPEEETFIPRQARMYDAVIANFTPSITGYSTASCRWKFYLNENNEEALYKEMTNRAIVTAERKNICGFTSTFIESRGELRVELNLDILDKDGNVLETLVAERKYRVQ